ncbi:MAG: hypothetical protein GX221_11175 [Candidatus Riflebacteria bacterium]|nr:hypothetical protein [Candidatus Riflebacteria bacterium]
MLIIIGYGLAIVVKEDLKLHRISACVLFISFKISLNDLSFSIAFYSNLSNEFAGI